MFYRSQRVLWRVFAPSAAECAEILPPFFGHFSAKPKDTQALAAPDATSWSCWPPDFRYKALFEKGGERLAWRFLAVRCLIELLENVVGSCRNHWYVAGASCQGTAHGACIVGGLGSWESASLFLVLKVIWIVNSETKCRKSVGCRFQIMKTNFGTRLIDLLVVSTDLQVPWSFLLAICLSRLFRPELIRKSRLQELLKDRDSVHQASDDLTSLTFDFFPSHAWSRQGDDWWRYIVIFWGWTLTPAFGSKDLQTGWSHRYAGRWVGRAQYAVISPTKGENCTLNAMFMKVTLAVAL